MINMSEIASSTEERVLTGVKVSQAVVLDGMKNAIALADRMLPSTVTGRVEDRVEGLPSAAPLVAGAFGFAGKLLDVQRQFAGDVVEIFQPAPTPKPAPNKTSAKKSTAKKAAPKKAAPKKSTAKKNTKAA